jgi:hypothetical protein
LIINHKLNTSATQSIIRTDGVPLVTSYRFALLSAGLLLLTCGLRGQSRANPGTFVPLPDPGYGLYYQDSAGAPNVASRWGYNDGWEDGRHDRNHGDTVQVEEKDKYTIPPDHGSHPGVTRDQYIRIYRQAYRQGYEHGSRL